MNFQTYVQTVRLRCKEFPPEKQLEHAQIGMITELGELGDLVKRAFVYGKPFDPVNLMEECGDWLWYFVLWFDVMQLHAGRLDTALQALQAGDAKSKAGFLRISEKTAVRGLMGITAALSLIDSPNDAVTADTRAAADYGLAFIYGLLLKHDFTVEQCLDANDAKLEKRTGKAFNAEAILNRDVAAERAILEVSSTVPGSVPVAVLVHDEVSDAGTPAA